MKKVKVEVKVDGKWRVNKKPKNPLSPSQKEDQKKPNREVMRVPRNNPVHLYREAGRKIKKIKKQIID